MLLLHVSLELMRGTYAGFAIYTGIFAPTGVLCQISMLQRFNQQAMFSPYLQDVIRKEFLFRHQIVINQVFQGFLFLLETLTPFFFFKLYRSMRRQKSSGFQPSVVRFEQENTLKTRVGICSNCFPSSRRQLYAFLITHVTHNALGTKHLFLFHCLFKELDRLLG